MTCMIEAGLCTWEQFETGKELLLDEMACYYEYRESAVTALDESLVKEANN